MTTTTANRVTTNNINIAKSVALWAIQLGLAYTFFSAGYAKLSGVPMMVGLFDAIGVGQWFRYATGGIEFGAAALLLIPGLQAFGAALLVPTMLGAILTHLLIVGGSFTLPLALLIGAAIVAYGRSEQILKHLR